MITFSLPIPVSINVAYANNIKGRVKTGNVKIWAAQAQYYIATVLGPAKDVATHRAGCEKLRHSCLGPIGKKFGVSIHKLRTAFKGRYRIEYRYFFPDDGLRDMLNFEKILTDFLVENNFLVDDQFITDARQRTMPPDPRNPRVEIDIFTID